MHWAFYHLPLVVTRPGMILQLYGFVIFVMVPCHHHFLSFCSQWKY